jgi:hypothetical protein
MSTSPRRGEPSPAPRAGVLLLAGGGFGATAGIALGFAAFITGAGAFLLAVAPTVDGPVPGAAGPPSQASGSGLLGGAGVFAGLPLFALVLAYAAGFALVAGMLVGVIVGIVSSATALAAERLAAALDASPAVRLIAAGLGDAIGAAACLVFGLRLLSPRLVPEAFSWPAVIVISVVFGGTAAVGVWLDRRYRQDIDRVPLCRLQRIGRALLVAGVCAVLVGTYAFLTILVGDIGLHGPRPKSLGTVAAAAPLGGGLLLVLGLITLVTRRILVANGVDRNEISGFGRHVPTRAPMSRAWQIGAACLVLTIAVGVAAQATVTPATPAGVLAAPSPMPVAPAPLQSPAPAPPAAPPSAPAPAPAPAPSEPIQPTSPMSADQLEAQLNTLVTQTITAAGSEVVMTSSAHGATTGSVAEETCVPGGYSFTFSAAFNSDDPQDVYSRIVGAWLAAGYVSQGSAMEGQYYGSTNPALPAHGLMINGDAQNNVNVSITSLCTAP